MIFRLCSNGEIHSASQVLGTTEPKKAGTSRERLKPFLVARDQSFFTPCLFGLFYLFYFILARGAIEWEKSGGVEQVCDLDI